MPAELWKLPVPATSLAKEPEIRVLQKRKCKISLCIEDDSGESVPIGLIFEGVEAFKCTYLTSCTAEMFNASYAKLVRLDTTSWLKELQEVLSLAGQASDELQHLMICFDDGPCFEFICLSFVEE